MRTIYLTSLISRVFLMITLGLGLVFWIAQLFGWIGLLVFLARIGFPSIHEMLGSFGVLGLLILGSVAVFIKGSRRQSVVGIIYALVVPAFGITQTLILPGSLHWLVQIVHLLLGIGAMMLILRIERRYRVFKQQERRETLIQPQGKPYSPLVARLARLGTAGHVVLYRLSGGKLGGAILGLPVLLLTTIGRKSGKQHTTPVAYFPNGGSLLASDRAWLVLSFPAHPR